MGGGHGFFAETQSFGELLQALEMTEEVFLSMFPELGYLKEQETFTPKERSDIVEILKRSAPLKVYLLQLAAEKRARVHGYLAQEMEDDDSFAVVEYWGRGYTQSLFGRLLNDMKGRRMPVPFYYARSILPSQGDEIRHNFTTSQESMIFIEAVFANMPYGTTEDYVFRDGRYEPVFLVNGSCDRELFEDMEQYLPVFTRDYLALCVRDREGLNRDLLFFSLSWFHAHGEDLVFTQVLSRLKDGIGMNTELREFAPALSDTMLQRMQKKVPRTKLTGSMDLSYHRGSDDVRAKYLKMYQLRESDNLMEGKLSLEEELKKTEQNLTQIGQLKETQATRRQWYDEAALHTSVENSILLVSDTDSLKEAVFYSLRDNLKRQTVFQVKEIGIRRYRKKHGDRKLMDEFASARFIVSAKPLEYLSSVQLREETQTIILNESAFTYSYHPSGNKSGQELEEMKRNSVICQIMASSPVMVRHLAVHYHIQAQSAFAIHGDCRSDVYFNGEFRASARLKLEQCWPASAGKKVILYLPTVRYRNGGSKYKDFLDPERLHTLIGWEYALAIHVNLPAGEYTQNLEIDGFSAIITKMVSMPEALCAADIVVGDWRDTFFETSLLHKPAFMYVNDAWGYLKNRIPICEFEDVQIGPMIHDEEDLADQLRHIDSYDYSMQERFRERFLPWCDGHSAERAVEYFLSNRGERRV